MRTKLPNERTMKEKLYTLQLRQALPLDAKELLSKRRVEEFYRFYDGRVYVSVSGGVDSRALGHLVRSIFPDVVFVFIDTGLEFPELKKQVKSFGNTIILKPEIPFNKVLKLYGYPVGSKMISKQIRTIRSAPESNFGRLCLTGITSKGNKSERWKLKDKWRPLLKAPFLISEQCCDVMKKDPVHKWEKETGNHAFIGMMAADSQTRELQYLQTGSCNNYRKGSSNPLMFWTKSDIFEYLLKYNLDYPKEVYGDIIKYRDSNGRWKFTSTGVQRTGCVFCMFGCDLERKETGMNRFQKMYKTHPQLWEYCMFKLGLKEVLEFIGEPTEPFETLGLYE